MMKKIIRFFNIFKKRRYVRYGECTPDKCSDLNGVVGAACCKLDYKCPFLKEENCKIYNFRAPNCRVFPRSPDDLKLVKNCGYTFYKK